MKTLMTTLALASALMFTACSEDSLTPQDLMSSPASDLSTTNWVEDPANQDFPLPPPKDLEDKVGDQISENAPPTSETPSCRGTCVAEFPEEDVNLKAAPANGRGEITLATSLEEMRSRPKTQPEQNPGDLSDRDPNIDPDMR